MVRVISNAVEQVNLRSFLLRIMRKASSVLSAQKITMFANANIDSVDPNIIQNTAISITLPEKAKSLIVFCSQDENFDSFIVKFIFDP